MAKPTTKTPCSESTAQILQLSILASFRVSGLRSSSSFGILICKRIWSGRVNHLLHSGQVNFQDPSARSRILAEYSE